MSNTQKFTATEQELKEKDCFTDRNNTDTLQNTKGEIIKIDNANFGIRVSGGNENPLLPCNLPENLQQAGMQVVFSGMVKETRIEELWAGQPFVLTAVAEQ